MRRKDLLLLNHQHERRLPVVSDGYSMLKNLYRDSWLAENRPYWLDNVLVRYDLQIKQRQQRGDQLNTVVESWENSKKLLRADHAGIPAQDSKLGPTR